MPPACGCATPRTSATATAASIALPPRPRMSRPARVAIGEGVASAARDAVTWEPARSGVAMTRIAMATEVLRLAPLARDDTLLFPAPARHAIPIVDELQTLQRQLGIDLVDVLTILDE